jgi:hypothetical protein
MRFEQNTVAVTRNLVIATVREIEAVVSFANAMCLHLWLRRKPLLHRQLLGMPAYSGFLSDSSMLCGDLGRPDTGSKRGRLLCQPILALASCPTGSTTA